MCTIQCNNIICNARMAKSEVRAVARGEDGESGLREGTGKIICLKVPLTLHIWLLFVNHLLVCEVA